MSGKHFLKRRWCSVVISVGAGALSVLISFKALALELNGNFIQGGLLTGQASPVAQVYLGERKLKLTVDGQFVIGLGRDFPSELSLTTRTDDGKEESYLYPIMAREYKISRVEGIAKKIMQPSAEDSARASEDARQIRAARGKISSRTDFLDAFQWPVTGRISGVFGSQRVYNGVPGRPHYGVDVAMPTGTRVNAPVSGLVVFAQPDTFYSGGLVILDHGHGLSSSFLHMSKLWVTAGEEVDAGQRIGEIGATGRASGPHLDWRMNWFDQKIDPQLLVPAMAEVLGNDKKVEK
ncbi:MAG: M23 family metallopeptidase [Pseudomonadales bacterium]